jgi:hypothetical protein
MWIKVSKLKLHGGIYPQSEKPAHSAVIQRSLPFRAAAELLLSHFS